MSVGHMMAYLKYRRFLAARQRDADDSLDIRETLLAERSNTALCVGYVEHTLKRAVGANMRRLFPHAAPLDVTERQSDATTYLLTGTLFADALHSHPGLQRAFQADLPLENMFMFELGFLASSHSWAHSFRQARPHMACLGYVYDDLAHYFMADYPNRLIRRLNSDHALSKAELARARALIDRIVSARISKYNAQPLTPPTMTRGYTRRVLVVDQTYADASTLYGRIDETGFEDMLLAALSENPDAEILIKTHPDTAWVPDKRTGYYNHLSDTGRVRILRSPLNPFLLFDQVDTVYVGTSQLGLEALFAGKTVVCFGAPFYAGWGLTDDRQTIPHRHRQRSLEEIFHYFYIWYTIYHLPRLGAQTDAETETDLAEDVPSQIEDVLDFIEENRPVSVPEPLYTASETPKISVIIPVYDVEPYIEDCLTSVQGQTLEDIEIITINDRSPDQSQAIIDRLAASDPRIRPVVLEKNIGQGFARNIGLEMARGEYVQFIDSDDYLAAPDHLQRLYDCANVDQADMVRGRKLHEHLEDEQGVCTGTRPDPSEVFFDQPFHAVRLEEAPYILQNRHFWTWLYRRDLLETHKIRFLTTQWEERPFLLQALLAAERLSGIDCPGLVYRVRRNSTARRPKTQADAVNQLANLEQMVEILETAGAFKPDSALRYTAGFMILQALHILFHGFAYRTAAATPQGRQSFLERLSVLLERAGLPYDAMPHDAHQLSRDWLGRHVYRLLVEALRLRRYEFVEIARTQGKITQEALFKELLRDPETPQDAAFQTALSLYARNDKVTPASDLKPVTPKPRLVVHVGQTKTGSTYIQHFLERNRAALLRAGIWVPEIGIFWQKIRPHKQAGHAHVMHEAIRGGTAIRDYIEAGLALAQGKIHTIVLSSEAFFLNRRSVLIADHFSGYPVEMIGYFRRQDDWANSQYVEFVAGGAMGRVSSRFREWINEPVTRERLDYFSYCQLWGARIGRDNVHARIYDRAELRDGDVLTDFLDTLGLGDLATLPRPPAEQSNEAAFARGHVELLREINRYDWPDAEQYLLFIDEVSRTIAQLRLQAGKSDRAGGAVVIEPHERHRLMQELDASNDKFAKAFLPDRKTAFSKPPGTAKALSRDVPASPVSDVEMAAVFRALEAYPITGLRAPPPASPRRSVKRDLVSQSTVKTLRGIYCDFVDVPAQADPGAELELEISLYNVSDFQLPRTYAGLALKLSYHVLDPNGKPVIWNGVRTVLPRAINHDCHLPIRVEMPNDPGRYLLQAAMVIEGQRWFNSLQTWPVTVGDPQGA